MKKAFTLGLCAGSLLLSGCSTPTTKEATEPSLLESIPFVYRPDIQQGNVITQEKINLLKPGMSKQQVRFILGTPLLVDVFHQDRWDYVYLVSNNRKPITEEKVSIFFENGKLTRVEGDMRPDPTAPAQNIDKESVVKVPDYNPPKKGVVERMLNSVGVSVQDEE